MQTSTFEQQQPLAPGRIETFETAEGKFFRSFLISTKHNDADWFIRRETGHDKVKSFIGRDFAIIPELIHKPIQAGGGGHIKGTREQILKGYADNSHGKIRELVGPFYYHDSPQDYWYDQITKLSDSRSASVLHQEGQRTWNGYDVSPHIFVNKGSDAEGWEDWEGAGLNLVIKGAFGNQSIITKFCDGAESKCFKDLMASTAKITDESIAELLTSHLSKFASTPHSMPDSEMNKPDSGLPDSGIGIKDKNKDNPTVNPQKDLTTAPIVEETVSIPKSKLAALEERAESFTEMENERKQEILGKLFEGIDDDKEREKEIKDYSKLDMKTVKMLKLYTDKITPTIHAKVKAELKAEAKEEEKEDENGNGEKDAKKAKDKSKEKDRSASSSGHLDKEPKHPKFTTPDYNPEDNKDGERHASVPEIRNEVYLLRQKFLKGRGNRED